MTEWQRTSKRFLRVLAVFLFGPILLMGAYITVTWDITERLIVNDNPKSAQYCECECHKP